MLLGAHASSPDMQTAAEARAADAGAPAEMLVSARARHAVAAAAADRATELAEPVDACATVDAVHASRAAWVRVLREGGVRLLLSGAPLSALTVQLCAEAGVCAVPGVEEDGLQSLATHASLGILRR